MNQSKYAFQAGLFIILSITAAIFLVARVAESRATPDSAKQYIAVFPAGEDISGLEAGAEVRLLGVKVGRVEEVSVMTPTTADEDASVHVQFVVGEGVELRQDGPEVQLQTALTGGAWLNILSVGTGEPVEDGGAIVADTNDLIGMMMDVRQEVKITLADLRMDLDEVSKELVETANSIEGSADSATTLVESLDQEIDTLMEETTGVMSDIRGVFGDSGGDMRTILAKLSSLSEKLDQEIPKTLAEINGFVNKAETSIDGVDTLMDELTGTATEARTLLADNRSDIDRTIESARRSVDELEGLVDDLRANPSRLIWPPDEKDLNNSDLYAAARSYAEAAEDLESAAAALHTAAKNGKADDAQLEALRSDLVKQFDYFEKLQAEVWQRFEK